MQARFDNSYARLPERLYARVRPTPVAQPGLLALNRPLAEELGLDADELASPAGVAVLAGNAVPEGAKPIALAYAGHQFGGFVPQLGDGRAILLGEIIDRSGERRDLQLKGSGRTPFSRGGDGRAALGPVLREYLVSEAMAALGVPTTRALAAVTTGERVLRPQPLPGAVLTRVASSHLRVGTFEFFAAREDHEALRLLTQHALERHYPERADDERPALALLDAVIGAQASLVARWLGVGFVHGVMNTDNTSISGETIDYGPCAFLDAFRSDRTFSSIDRQGRYAYGEQPRIALWNLTRLAEALLPIVDAEETKAVELVTGRLQSFGPRFSAAHQGIFRAKLGLADEHERDVVLIRELLACLDEGGVDFTLFFRRLANAAERASAESEVSALFPDPAVFSPWAANWRSRLEAETTPLADRVAKMNRVNPLFIPRNHQVEAMIAAATDGDLEAFRRLMAVLARPYDDQPAAEDLAAAPGEEQWRYRTFCGT